MHIYIHSLIFKPFPFLYFLSSSSLGFFPAKLMLKYFRLFSTTSCNLKISIFIILYKIFVRLYSVRFYLFGLFAQILWKLHIFVYLYLYDIWIKFKKLKICFHIYIFLENLCRIYVGFFFIKILFIKRHNFFYLLFIFYFYYYNSFL